ncbi:hypothetical protein PMAYCL1PPCAC_13647 [Pristionchus mayeri]|uniref:Plethodontid modulating factor n=1 Tax=Pristionchus mayeri TaxID=1317129 RepID=A0AAN4ZS80_9BILA|nr:hypothetical protein PMAYCL1PPCAC_13647 [Pristionchus mayeri]
MSRLSLFVIFCLIPAVLSLKCLHGSSQNGNDPTKFAEHTCTSKQSTEYCLTGTTKSGDTTTVIKDCDVAGRFATCKSTGCMIADVTTVCCCNYDDCNE